jgi:hypothetical protein
MPEVKTGEERGSQVADRRALANGALATLVVMVFGAWFYRWLLFSPGPVQTKFSALGDAVGPFGTLATVGALLAALWSVRLQRQELALTRQEMKDSTAQLAKAADAQQELATATAAAVEQAKRTAQAQEELSRAQREHTVTLHVANVIAERMQAAQHAGRVASLESTIANLRSDAYLAPDPHNVAELLRSMDERLQPLEARRAYESEQATIAEQRASALERKGPGNAP